jgi:Lipocalin-like domain
MARTVLLSAALCLCALTNTSQAQSSADVARRFVGTWRLVSWTQRLADGTTRPDPRNVGYIIYTDVGYMCYASMAANRPRWASDNSPTGPEAVATMGVPFNSYCARVEVRADKGFVLHHVEVDKSPNMIGRTRKRWFTFQGPNRVALRMDPSELTAPVVESTLLWERVQK